MEFAALLLLSSAMGLLFGRDRHSFWKWSLPAALALALALPTWEAIHEYREFRREVQAFRSEPQFLNDGAQRIEGVHSTDRTRVTFTLPSRRNVTLGEPEGPWYASDTAEHNLPAAAARGAIVFLTGVVAYLVGRLFGARRRA